MKRIWISLFLLGSVIFPAMVYAQTSGTTPPPPPVCGSTNAGAIYTSTGTSPATVYTCSYYNLAWQWVVNPSYGGLVSYPTVPSTCSGTLPVFLAGWPNTKMYVCVSGFPQAIGGSGTFTFPGANTIAIANTDNTGWRTPLYSDVTALWATCTAGYLKWDGTCSTPGGSGTVNSGTTGQIAYYPANGAAVSGENTVPVNAGGTGATTAAGALANLGGLPLTGGTLTGALTGSSASFSGTVTASAVNLVGNPALFAGATADVQINACLAIYATCDATGYGATIQTINALVEIGTSGASKAVIFNPATVFTPSSATVPSVMFQVDRNGQILGSLNIVPQLTTTTYSGKFVQVTDTITNTNTFKIEGVHIDASLEPGPRAGYGLYIAPTSGGHIQLGNLDNIYINGLLYDLYLLSSGSGTYVNGLNFSNLQLGGDGTLLTLNSVSGSGGISGNNFSNVQADGLGVALNFIGSNNTSGNTFSGLRLWDSPTPISNAIGAHNNTFVGFFDTSYTDTLNVWVVNGGITVGGTPGVGNFGKYVASGSTIRTGYQGDFLFGLSGNGVIHSDSNWGMIFTADTTSPAVADYYFTNSAGTGRFVLDKLGNFGVGTNSTASSDSFYVTPAGVATAASFHGVTSISTPLITAPSGNVSISPPGSGIVTLNYFSGTGGVGFFDGAGGQVGGVDSLGNFYNANTIFIPHTVNGYNGNASGIKIPLSLNWTTPTVLTSVCHDANGNLTDASCPGGGGGGTTTNALTAAATGGAAPGTTFDGSTARTFDYHSFGAQPALSLLAGTYTNGDMCTYASSGTLLNCNTAVPSVGTWGALAYPTWTTGTPFVKMTAAGTFALDTTVYQTALTNPVTGPGSGATVGHMAVMGNTSGTSITDGGAVPSAYTLPTATSSTLGGVKPDGTTISNSSGAISVANPYNPASVAITGGTIDGTVIGATTPAAGTFTSVQLTGTTPSSLSLPAGTGSIPTLPANSAGFAAPVTGGTAYVFKMPATITAGILHAAAPATGDGVNESAMTSSLVAIADLAATGTPGSTTYLRGDNTWATPSGGGSGTVNSGTAWSPTYYAATGTAVSGTTPFTGLEYWAGSAAPTAASAAQVVAVISTTAVANATAAGTATNTAGGAVGSAPYQSASGATAFIASPTTTGHYFVYSWQPTGSAIDPVALDLATWFSAQTYDGTLTSSQVTTALTFTPVAPTVVSLSDLTTAAGGAFGTGAYAAAYSLPTATTTVLGGVLLGATGGANVYLGYTPANCTAGTTGSDCLTLSSGVVTVPNGGTGLATLTAHAVQVGEGTSTPAQVGPDSVTTHFLASGGSSADPAFRALASGDLPAATPTAAGAVIQVANTTFTTSTGSVSANNCNSAVQVAMTGVTTSMAFIISASSDTSGITGWGSTGGLILDVWPTAGYLNYKICNQTALTIASPGAVTFNVGAR